MSDQEASSPEGDPIQVWTFKCRGFCGRTERRSVTARTRSEASEKLGKVASTVKPYSEARLVNRKDADR